MKYIVTTALLSLSIYVQAETAIVSTQTISAPMSTQTITTSEASIKELFKLTKFKEQLASITDIDTVMTNFEPILDGLMQNVLRGRTATIADKAVKTRMHNQLRALMQKKYLWENRSHVLIKVYQQTFNQAEIDAMLAFYTSELGRSTTQKKLAFDDQLSQLITEIVTGVMPAIENITNETKLALKANHRPLK